MTKLWMAAAGILLGALLSGCGGAATGEVSGTVTFEGQTVEQGSIAFVPDGGGGPTAGGSIAGGKYTVSKVPAGRMKVVISGAKDIKEQKMSYEAKAKPVITSSELLPTKYSDYAATELRYDVVVGKQTRDFTLTK